MHMSLGLLALYLAIFLPAFAAFVLGLRGVARTAGHPALRAYDDHPDA